METIEVHLLSSAKAALDELAWGRATMEVRFAEPHMSAAA